MERNPLIWEAARLPLPLGAWRSSSQTPPADPWSWGSGIWPDVAPSRTGRRRSWGGQSGSWGRLWWAWRCEICQPCSGSGHTSPPSEPALREGEREEVNQSVKVVCFEITQWNVFLVTDCQIGQADLPNLGLSYLCRHANVSMWAAFIVAPFVYIYSRYL